MANLVNNFNWINTLKSSKLLPDTLPFYYIVHYIYYPLFLGGHISREISAPFGAFPQCNKRFTASTLLSANNPKMHLIDANCSDTVSVSDDS